MKFEFETELLAELRLVFQRYVLVEIKLICCLEFVIIWRQKVGVGLLANSSRNVPFSASKQPDLYGIGRFCFYLWA